jgi:hypothetical protein
MEVFTQMCRERGFFVRAMRLDANDWVNMSRDRMQNSQHLWLYENMFSQFRYDG